MSFSSAIFSRFILSALFPLLLCCPADTLRGQTIQVSVLVAGAHPDGKTDNTFVLQSLIDSVSGAGGGRIIFPAGRYLSGVLHLKSGVELHLDSAATLLASSHRRDYGPSLHASAFLVAENVRDISLTGAGTIDGQGQALLDDIYRELRAGNLVDPEWKIFNPWFQRRPVEANRPRLIRFTNCRNVIIKDLHIINGSSWIQDYRNCHNLLIDGITVVSNCFWNNDGIDLVDCVHAVVRNCDINVADDGICLKSSDRNLRCDDVLVRDCRVRSSASAIKLGTASAGGFRHIRIRNIEVYDTYRSAIAIESVDGGSLEDVEVDSIHALHTGNAFFIRLGHRNKDSVYSTAKGIRISHMYVEVPADKPDRGYPMEGPALFLPPPHQPDTQVVYAADPPWYHYGIDSLATPYPHSVMPASVTGLPGHPIQNLQLNDIRILMPGNGKGERQLQSRKVFSGIPELAEAYPEFSMFGDLPCWALFVRHAENMSIENLSFKSIQKDGRPAILIDDLKEGSIRHLEIHNSGARPVIYLRKTRDLIPAFRMRQWKLKLFK